MYHKLLIILITCFCSVSYAQTETFEIGEKDFLLNGKLVVIRSGELHYSRIPQEYWRHRLQMCKAMGLNAVCAYMFWNAHEPEPGQFNFSGMADVAEFCRIAQEEGLLVILRPGPYSCAEWDFGGFPYWLLKDPAMKVRSQHPGYLEACRRYILRVGRELVSQQITRGGPIIMVQVENEYGSYGSDKEYMGLVRDYWKEAGFDVPFFSCDGPRQLPNDVREDIFPVVNFGSNPEGPFKTLREIRKDGPLMCGEFYPAWYDKWGKPHMQKDVKEIAPNLKYMLDHRASFSLYMVHGGTSFAFTAGANYADRFEPQTTSYDYDAPISEAGWATPKYRELRKLFSQYLNPGETVPEIPARNGVITIEPIVFNEADPLIEDLKAPIITKRPQPFEQYDQNQGCVLYQVNLPAGKSGVLKFQSLSDYAIFFLNHELITTYDRRGNPGKWVTGFNEKGQNIIMQTNEDFTIDIPLPAREEEAQLRILVESMGHINYGGVINEDRKGIAGKVIWKGDGQATELTDWRAYLLPLNKEHLASLKYSRRPPFSPAFHRATFTLEETGDTFLDLSGWGKGVVWVNGHNLGRYWRIGPTQTMYLPGPWLKKGKNEIIVLELLGAEKAFIRGLAEPILGQVRDR